MPIKPGKDEKQDSWMGRCVPEMMGQNGGTTRPQEQAVAACMTMWRDKDKALKANGDDIDITPDDDESREDFMDRCMDATDGDDFTCQMAWDNRTAKGVRYRTHVTEGTGLEFILSDATPDRMGDVIETNGWELDN